MRTGSKWIHVSKRGPPYRWKHTNEKIWLSFVTAIRHKSWREHPCYSYFATVWNVTCQAVELTSLGPHSPFAECFSRTSLSAFGKNSCTTPFNFWAHIYFSWIMIIKIYIYFLHNQKYKQLDSVFSHLTLRELLSYRWAKRGGEVWCDFQPWPPQPITLQWRHNERDGVSNRRHLDCLLNRFFRRRSRKTPKLRVTGLYGGNSPVTGEFSSQRASNAENISIWWRHHGLESWTSSPLALYSLWCCGTGDVRVM